MLEDLVRRTRSHRRFDQKVGVDIGTLRWLVGLARCCGSGTNLQPLKFVISCDLSTNARIFACTRWAAHLRDWPGPAEGERPAAYIVILGDTDISSSFGCDHGIAAQTMMLGATEKGLAGCMIGSIDRAALQKTLDIPVRCEILLILALGKAGETVVLEDLPPGEDTCYYRDEHGVHHVPKRSVEELIVAEYG